MCSVHWYAERRAVMEEVIGSVHFMPMRASERMRVKNLHVVFTKLSDHIGPNEVEYTTEAFVRLL